MTEPVVPESINVLKLGPDQWLARSKSRPNWWWAVNHDYGELTCNCPAGIRAQMGGYPGNCHHIQLVDKI